MNQRPSRAAAWAVAMVLGGSSAFADVASSALDARDALDPNRPAAINAAGAATVDFSALLDPAAPELPPDPQPLSFTGRVGDTAEKGPPRGVGVTWVMSRPAELSNSPMAPLPPAIVAGPIGIAFATFIAWRAKRRGGRI